MSTYFSEPRLARIPNLLKEIREGVLRIPRFQRPFVWSDEQRRLLMDSIKQGMPIGSILVWRTRQRIATYDRLGPFVLPPPPPGREVSYVLDGHQRLAALYGALAAGPTTPETEEVLSEIYYDLARRVFCQAPADGPPEVTLLPLRVMLSPERLYAHQKLLLDLKHENRVAFSNAAENVTNYFKDYLLPVVQIVTDDLEMATEAFRRINSQATPLGEIHMASALCWTAAFDLQEQLARIQDRLAPCGWGGIDAQLLLDLIKAGLGLRLDRAAPEAVAKQTREDPTLLRELPRHIEWAAQLLSARCGVAGPAALPHRLQLVCLVEAASANGGPIQEPLAQELERWFWLTSLTDHFSRLAGPQIEAAIEHARGLARGERGPRPPGLSPSEAPLPEEFDLGSSRSRTLALLLVRLGPLDAQGQPLPAAELLAALGSEAAPRIVPPEVAAARAPENHWIADPRGLPHLREALMDPRLPHGDALLASHAIPQVAIEALRSGDAGGFLRHRRDALHSLTRRLFADLLEAAPAPPAPAAAPPEVRPRAQGMPLLGVPVVALFGGGDWMERAVRGAGLRVHRPGTEQPHVVVEALPAEPGLEQRWRIHAGEIELAGEGEGGLSDALCRLRAAAMASEGPVRLALWTYAEDDIVHPGSAYSVGALEPAVEEEALRRFEDGIAAPLARIRQVLGARGGDRWVLVHPRCLLGAALCVGAVFHHQTGFWVDCEQGGETWDLNRQPGKLPLPHLALEVSSPAGASRSAEIHALISVSRDVRAAYDGWLRQHPEHTPRHRLLVAHRNGPGPDALRPIEAVDWADAIRQRLTPLRTSPDAALRIFCAAPAAFCVALGRSLNALGQVIAMDLSKKSGRYFASFVLR